MTTSGILSRQMSIPLFTIKCWSHSTHTPPSFFALLHIPLVNSWYAYSTGPDFLQGLQAKLLTTEKLQKPVLKRKSASFDRSVFAALQDLNHFQAAHYYWTDCDRRDNCGNAINTRMLRLFVNRVHDQLEAHTNTPNLTMSCVKKLKTKDSDCWQRHYKRA